MAKYTEAQARAVKKYFEKNDLVKMEIRGAQSRFFFAQRIPKGIAIRQAAAREVTLKSM